MESADAEEAAESRDVIAELVDEENRREREREAQLRGGRAAAGEQEAEEEAEILSESDRELGKELWVACAEGKCGAVKMLLTAGASPNMRWRHSRKKLVS